MSDDNTVFGRPVTGEISRSYERRVIQEEPEKFIEFLDEVLALPYVEAVRWDQNTPYFNDGEPCVFSSNDYSVNVKTSWLDEWIGEDSGVDLRGEFDRDGWVASGRDYARYNEFYSGEVDGHDTSELVEAVNKFQTRLGGPHDDWLLSTFGDHATVTATPEGFDVEYYEHD